uniref:RING-type domain-containing protein n=1 Tax=Erpetoichthys calabaricus TaxID=27687 RepID=A0A8C4X2G7_ERPCA
MQKFFNESLTLITNLKRALILNPDVPLPNLSIQVKQNTKKVCPTYLHCCLLHEIIIGNSRINIITDAQTSNHGVPQGLIITIGVHHFYMRLTNQLQEGLFYHFLQIFSRGQHASFSTRTFENTRSLSTCTVCLAAYIRGDLIRSLPCYHEFHANCIDRWLHRNSTCPVCRRTVFRSLQY